MVRSSDESTRAQLSRAVAATCVESMELQITGATKWPGNLQTAIVEVDVARVEQPESGDSAVVLSLVFELKWLGNVYNGQ